jgi:hypothetical protein
MAHRAEVPNLPGFRTNRPTAQKRPQNLTLVDGMVYERKPPKVTEAEPAERFKATIERYASMSTSEREASQTAKMAMKRTTIPLAPEVLTERVVSFCSKGP